MQDKAQVLSDVRSIIAEQLGAELDTVRMPVFVLIPQRSFILSSIRLSHVIDAYFGQYCDCFLLTGGR